MPHMCGMYKVTGGGYKQEMDRSRSTVPVPAAERAEAQSRARPTPHEADISARLLDLQATGGNQMVVRLLAAARSADAHTTPDPSLAAAIRNRLGGGSPLRPELRAEAEAGFQQPLGDVRVHTDAPAAALASRLRADAFTTGTDIFFNAGKYDPDSRDGYQVLTHELTHTLQPPAAARTAADGLSVSEPHDPHEREARAVAERLTAGRGSAADRPQVSGARTADVQRSADGPLVVQRHSSWEHTMLGDVPPAELGDATVQANSRLHLLEDLRRRMKFFAEGASADPRAQFPDVRWVQLKASSLWVSYGELNALADYLPNPETADTLPAPQIIPVLQKMRSEVHGSADAMIGGGPRGEWKGEATSSVEYISEKAGAVSALDNATAGLGADRYAGLLARNACHFAPFSWQRWEQFHNEAADHARQHFASRSGSQPLRDVPKTAEENARQAMLKNGYADHFLQDSFAAGHLVNKTLVMQWWVDYLNDYNTKNPLPEGGQFPGAPDPDVLRRMGSQAQPGVAGRELYRHRPDSKGTKREDSASGAGPADPQTAQERAGRDGRVSGSGVAGATAAEREANYQAYLRLLNNTQAQLATGEVHNHLNKTGLSVLDSTGPGRVLPNLLGITIVSGNGTRTRIGGDDTLVTKSDRLGAEQAARAAELSRQAIDELMTTGKTAITTEHIFAFVPVSVVPDNDGDPVPLEQWQDTTLRALCFEKIFPEYYNRLQTTAGGFLAPEMVSGGVSRDAAR